VVKSADLVDGMLEIQLENVIPENKKPRKILLNDKNFTTEKLFTVK
jgi:HSP20 family molecular chaperone IbpA